MDNHEKHEESVNRVGLVNLTLGLLPSENNRHLVVDEENKMSTSDFVDFLWFIFNVDDEDILLLQAEVTPERRTRCERISTPNNLYPDYFSRLL